MRVADFFCGAGGFSEGFRQAGFEIVFAVDKWEPAVTTYKGNKPGVNVIQDDVLRISYLPDDEFEALVPDTEVIIGSPPCQSFSNSNKSGNGDKSLGIRLIEAYLRIIARKMKKKDSILKYWVLENVPNSQKYIKESYTAEELGLQGDFILSTRGPNAGIYNAKNFGAPTNRKRFLCGYFPPLIKTHEDKDAKKLRDVLNSLGDPLEQGEIEIIDVNYPDLVMMKSDISDSQYIRELAPFEWETSKRLKQDKGYMGVMSFPENLDNPARTVMATMTGCSREAMIFGYKDGRYRLPTVRETASMMSFPLDYRFYGKTVGIKHTLVGNAVPPKLSYAIAKAIVTEANIKIPNAYVPIIHDPTIPFENLNGKIFPIKQEQNKRDISKFKYHIPYMILDKYRVELTNYHSDFENKKFIWDVEIHYSQGKKQAKKYIPKIDLSWFTDEMLKELDNIIDNKLSKNICSENELQKNYCLPEVERKKLKVLGPYELLDMVKTEIDQYGNNDSKISVKVQDNDLLVPVQIMIGYYLLNAVIERMRKEGSNANN